MMGGNNTVTFRETVETVADGRDAAGYLMAEYEGSLGETVPLQQVAAADPAGMHLQQQFALPYHRKRASLQSQVAIVVVDGYAIVLGKHHAAQTG
jgi:hypothetical protein